MGTPGPEHFIFIPGVLLIGIVWGYILGARAARAELEKRRALARERLLPLPAACDRESRFPKEVFDEAHAIGLVNPTLPAEYGGAGLSDVDSSFITEELAYACSGIQTSMTANTLGLTPIKLAGTEEQKKKYLGWLVKEPIWVAYATS